MIILRWNLLWTSKYKRKTYRYFDYAVLSCTIVVGCGPGSSVGIATELRAGRSWIESRWGRDFPPVQTGPGAHPASCKMGTGSFPGVNCGRGVLLTTHPHLVPRLWKSRAIYISTLPLGHTGPVTKSLYTLPLPLLSLLDRCGSLRYSKSVCVFVRSCELRENRCTERQLRVWMKVCPDFQHFSYDLHKICASVISVKIGVVKVMVIQGRKWISYGKYG